MKNGVDDYANCVEKCEYDNCGVKEEQSRRKSYNIFPLPYHCSSAIKLLEFFHLFAVLHPSFHNYFIINVENKTPYRARHLLRLNAFFFSLSFCQCCCRSMWQNTDTSQNNNSDGSQTPR